MDQLVSELKTAVDGYDGIDPNNIYLSVMVDDPLGVSLVAYGNQPLTVIDEDDGCEYTVPNGPIIVAASGDTLGEAISVAHNFLAGRRG